MALSVTCGSHGDECEEGCFLDAAPCGLVDTDFYLDGGGRKLLSKTSQYLPD